VILKHNLQIPNESRSIKYALDCQFPHGAGVVGWVIGAVAVVLLLALIGVFAFKTFQQRQGSGAESGVA
jgi:hypothetical protein